MIRKPLSVAAKAILKTFDPSSSTYLDRIRSIDWSARALRGEKIQIAFQLRDPAGRARADALAANPPALLDLGGAALLSLEIFRRGDLFEIMAMVATP